MVCSNLVTTDKTYQTNFSGTCATICNQTFADHIAIYTIATTASRDALQNVVLFVFMDCIVRLQQSFACVGITK